MVTAEGLWTFSTATFERAGFTGGLGDPRGIAVSPDGSTIYVTDTNGNSVKAISASTGTVTATIGVGDLPWQIVVSANGKTAYVADPDSNAVSVIDTATDQVTDTISVLGDPDTLALTADGSQLWVGQASAAYVTLIDTSGDTVVGAASTWAAAHHCPATATSPPGSCSRPRRHRGHSGRPLEELIRVLPAWLVGKIQRAMKR